MNALNLPLTADIIIQKALEVAKELNIDDFKASLNWFEYLIIEQ